MENFKLEVNGLITTYHINKAVTGSGFLPPVSNQPTMLILATLALVAAVAARSFDNTILQVIVLAVAIITAGWFAFQAIRLDRGLAHGRRWFENKLAWQKTLDTIARQTDEVVYLLPELSQKEQGLLFYMATMAKLNRKDVVKNLLRQALVTRLGETEFIQELARDLKVR